jgi:hypothetical protein
MNPLHSTVLSCACHYSEAGASQNPGDGARPQVWFYNEGQRRWEQEPAALAGHTGWVRDVAWAPNLGLNANTIASASQVDEGQSGVNLTAGNHTTLSSSLLRLLHVGCSMMMSAACDWQRGVHRHGVVHQAKTSQSMPSP